MKAHSSPVPPFPGHSPESCAPLTPREKEVLAWLVEGKRDAEIGSILGISSRTVQKHVEHLFEKLAVETRTAAVRMALCGLLHLSGTSQ